MENSAILDMFKRAGGYLTASELLRKSVHTLTIRNLVDQGAIETVKRGLSRLPAAELTPHTCFISNKRATKIQNNIFIAKVS